VKVRDKGVFPGRRDWGFRAADVLELLQEAKCAPQRLPPFVDLPRLQGAVWIAWSRNS
jgi:hypothetical protein